MTKSQIKALMEKAQMHVGRPSTVEEMSHHLIVLDLCERLLGMQSALESVARGHTIVTRIGSWLEESAKIEMSVLITPKTEPARHALEKFGVRDE